MIVLTAGGRSASTLNSHKHLHLCLACHAPLPVWDMKHTGNSGNKECCQYHRRWGLCYHKHWLSAGQVHITQNSVKGVSLYGTWQGNERALFGYSSGEALPLQRRLVIINRSRKSTSCWTSVTLRKSYIQFPSTTHTCVLGPCLHKRWLTNDMDSQTITMMNLAFSLVKKITKQKKTPQNSNTCFHTRLFFMIGEETWFTLSGIKHTCCGRQKSTSLQP